MTSAIWSRQRSSSRWRAAAAPRSRRALPQSSIHSLQSYSAAQASISARSRSRGCSSPARRSVDGDVEAVLVEGERVGEQLVLRPEPVEHGRRAGPGPLGDVGDPGGGKSALADHLSGGSEDLRLADVIDLRARTQRSRPILSPQPAPKIEPLFKLHHRASAPPARSRAAAPGARRPGQRAASTSIAGSAISALTPAPSSRAMARSATAPASTSARNSPLSTPAWIRASIHRAVALVQPRRDRTQARLAHGAQPQLHPEHPVAVRAARLRQALADRPGQAGGRRRGLAVPFGEATVANQLEGVDQRLLEQLLAGREVVMHERGGGAGPHRHPGDPHLVDALRRDQVAGGLEDPLPGALRHGDAVEAKADLLPMRPPGPRPRRRARRRRRCARSGR